MRNTRTRRTAVATVGAVTAALLGSQFLLASTASAACVGPNCTSPYVPFTDPDAAPPPETTVDKVNFGLGILSAVFSGLPEGGEFGPGAVEGPAGAGRGGEVRVVDSESGGRGGEGSRESGAGRTEVAGTAGAVADAGAREAPEVVNRPTELDRGVAYTVPSSSGAASDYALGFETLVTEGTESAADGPIRYSTGPTRLPESDPNYDSDTDDFDEYYRDRLPQPTPQAEVADAVAVAPDRTVTLWRGTRIGVAEAMARNGSASGDTASAETGRPSRQAVQDQVGLGGVLPEFTTSPGIAEGFSYNNALVVVDVQARYLAQGSHSEGGWIADRTAPVTVRAIVDRTGHGSGGAQPNTS
ncbi:DUF4765 family protein [Streptomyces sp. C10-9-1]|uniref:DUF4765 family protein n=1 Tax=Streptomyces sp. C10-9-1 TaxID=1859285 RepID=UPI002112FAE0|nr:DUF4765 family protein [Streptomyces sp. C10-9-1]MCQ6554984.1 DUF4765 family protein [Streptomyces sp. C10-9-1]